MENVMSDTPTVEPYYQKRAESIVDMLFDSQLFNTSLSRKELQAVEDYIAYEFQSGISNGIKLKATIARSKERK